MYIEDDVDVYSGWCGCICSGWLAVYVVDVCVCDGVGVCVSVCSGCV